MAPSPSFTMRARSTLVGGSLTAMLRNTEAPVPGVAASAIAVTSVGRLTTAEAVLSNVPRPTPARVLSRPDKA